MGSYTVVVDATNFTGTGALVGYSATATGQGTTATDSNGSPASVSLTTANDETIDFGYYAAMPGIKVLEADQRHDNDTGTGPYVPVGSTVTWTYDVTNTTGNVPLAGVTVTDSSQLTPGDPRQLTSATRTLTACSTSPRPGCSRPRAPPRRPVRQRRHRHRDPGG